MKFEGHQIHYKNIKNKVFAINEFKILKNAFVVPFRLRKVEKSRVEVDQM